MPTAHHQLAPSKPPYWARKHRRQLAETLVSMTDHSLHAMSLITVMQQCTGAMRVLRLSILGAKSWSDLMAAHQIDPMQRHSCWKLIQLAAEQPLLPTVPFHDMLLRILTAETARRQRRQRP